MNVFTYITMQFLNALQALSNWLNISFITKLDQKEIPVRNESKGTLRQDKKKSPDLAMLNELTWRVADLFLEPIFDNAYASDSHPENLGATEEISYCFDEWNADTDIDDDEVEEVSDSKCNESITIQIRYHLAKTFLYCHCDEVDLILEMYFAQIKDLTPPSYPDFSLDDQGTKFWSTLRKQNSFTQRRWSVCKVILYDNFAFTLGIHKPLQTVDSDALYQLVEESMSTKLIPVATQWEVDDLNSKFCRYWPNFALHRDGD